MEAEASTHAQRAPEAAEASAEPQPRERPDLGPMSPLERLKRCAALLERRLDDSFARFDLCLWEFDVLATLRRAGAPYRLAPTALFSTLGVTSGTMTHRLRRLEGRGLVHRLPDPKDARSLLVELTPAGLQRVDHALAAHLESEHAILAALSPAAALEMNDHLAALQRALTPPTPEKRRANG